MKHHVTISSKGGKILIKRHDINGWTLIDEQLFDASDVAGMAEHTGCDEEQMKGLLDNTSDQMVHANAALDSPSDNAPDLGHHVVHGEYIDADDGEHDE